MATKYDTAWLNADTGEVHSPKGRLIWTHSILTAGINKKLPPGPNNKPRHNTVLLLSKGVDIAAISAEIGRAAEAQHGKNWKTKKLEYPVVKTVDHDKLKEYSEQFPLALKVASNEGFPPFVFGPDAKAFTGNAADIYSGRWAVIAGNAWAWKPPFDKGIGWNFSRIQLLDHDEPIAGGRSATSSGFESVNVLGGEYDVGGGKATATKAESADDVFGDAVGL